MRIKPLEFLKSVFNQEVFSKPKRLIVYTALAAILAGVIVTFSVPAVARGFSLLFATQGFTNEDTMIELFPAMMPQVDCPVGSASCANPVPPGDCKTASGSHFPCYKPFEGAYCVPCG